MRIMEKLVGEKARQSAEMLPPFGPGFERRITEKLETLQVMVSEFNDPGPDFCEFQGYDAAGQCIGTLRIRGY